MDAKEIAKYATICRKKGIESIKIGPDYVEFKLSAELPKTSRRSKEPQIEEQQSYTEEQIALWSSMGIPEVANG